MKTEIPKYSELKPGQIIGFGYYTFLIISVEKCGKLPPNDETMIIVWMIDSTTGELFRHFEHPSMWDWQITFSKKMVIL